MPLTSPNNIEVLDAAGIVVPPASEWWIDHPSVAEIKAALVAPYINDPGGAGVCIRRLLQRPLTFANVDVNMLASIKSGLNGPLEYALAAWQALEIYSDTSTYNTEMAAAKTRYETEDISNFTLLTGGNSHKQISAMLSLDQIVWPDMAAFEDAFTYCLHVLENEPAGDENSGSPSLWNDDRGYWYNEVIKHSRACVRVCLAVCVHGVNPGGASHTWADGVLNDLGPEVEDGDPHTYSPIHQCNVNSLLAITGGIQMGTRNAPMSSYEGYYVQAIYTWMKYFDHATGGTWDLINKCLLGKTRHESAVLEEDAAVVKTTMVTNSAHGAANDIMARTYQDGVLQWLIDRSHPTGFGSSNSRTFRYLAGPKPTATGPADGVVAEQKAGRWYYKQSRANPEQGLRFFITNQHLTYGRYPFDNGANCFAYNNVGLVPCCVQRMVMLPALANGLHLSLKDNGDDPHISRSDAGGPPGTTAGWRYGQDSHKYTTTSGSARNPSEVALDPQYVLDTTTFSESGGVYTWTYDYTHRLSTLSDIGIEGKVNLVTQTVTFDPANRRATILTTVEADPDVFVGWFGSPNYEPILIADGFEFTDGQDTIRCTYVPQNGFTVSPEIRNDTTNPFLATDGDVLPLDEYQLVTGRNRVNHNVSYTPDAYQSRYEMLVTYEANPGSPADPLAPAAPSNLVATPNSETHFNLSWQDNSNNEDSFSVMRSTDGVVYSQVASLPANTTSYDDYPSNTEIDYYYRIDAVNATGSSASTAVGPISLIEGTSPAAPSNLSYLPNIDSFYLMWDDNSDNEDAFEVYRSTTGQQFFLREVLGQNSTNHIDPIELDTNYWYQVRAINEYGEAISETIGPIRIDSGPPPSVGTNKLMPFGRVIV